jgi:hypothetical protein
MEKANENGYSVIRIIQEDILFDTFDWKTELNKTIISLIEIEIPQNIFINN